METGSKQMSQVYMNCHVPIGLDFELCLPEKSGKFTISGRQ